MWSAQHVGGLPGHYAARQPSGSSQVLEVTVETLVQPQQAGRVSSNAGTDAYLAVFKYMCSTICTVCAFVCLCNTRMLEIGIAGGRFKCIYLLPPCGVTSELKSFSVRKIIES